MLFIFVGMILAVYDLIKKVPLSMLQNKINLINHLIMKIKIQARQVTFPAPIYKLQNHIS